MRIIGSFIIITALMAGVLGHALGAPVIKNRKYYEMHGDIIWEVPMNEKMIALTFDDGPDPGDTPAILDLLKQYHAKATFFVVGKKVELYPKLARREVAEGHEIANHTYNHIYFTKRMSVENIQREVQHASQIIESITEIKPKLFRPPGGFYNDNVILALKKSGYQIIMWSWHQDTKDWRSPGVQSIINKVVNNSRNGDIVLLHDYVDGQTQTIAALKQILPVLESRGYQFVTVSELLAHRKATPVKE